MKKGCALLIMIFLLSKEAKYLPERKFMRDHSKYSAVLDERMRYMTLYSQNLYIYIENIPS